MALVRLHFPVDVVIEPIDKDNTVWDNRAREPVHRVARIEQLTIKAQVQFTNRRIPEFNLAGVTENTLGHLVVLQSDLTRLGWEPQRGDKIVSITGKAGTYYITWCTPRAHKGGTNQTMHLGFNDRMPGREQ